MAQDQPPQYQSPYGSPTWVGYGAGVNGAPAYGGAPPPAAPYNAMIGCPPYQQGYGPYSGPPPPYPPAAPAYVQPALGSYSYTNQTPADPKNIYGRPASTAPGSTEVGSLPAEADKITAQISTQIRHAFVRKVLGILAVQILVTFGIASVFGFVPVLKTFLLEYYWIIIIATVCALVLQLALICVPNLARKVPTNFLLMTGITLCYSIVIAYGAVASSLESFLIAIGATFIVVVGLMLFACQTKYDFTGCGTFVLIALIVLMIFGIMCIFMHNRITHLIYSSLATLLFCFILVYDTQQVVGGKHRKYQYSIDDYIFAALTLYLDIIIIFLNILALADNA